MKRTRLVLALFVLTLFVSSVTLVAATGNYDLETDTNVPVPETTVENPEDDTEEFIVTRVGLAEPGDNVSVGVTPPNDNRYAIFFRTEDNEIIDNNNGLQGTQTVTFSTASESAGSYVITVGETSDPDTILPVVIQAYTVDQLTLDGEPLDGTEITTDETPEATVELRELEDAAIDTVTLTLWNDDTEEEVPLSADDNHTFTGSLPDVDPDDYNTQIRVRGGDTVNSEPELIGLSENYDLSVTEAESSDDGNGGGTGGGGGGVDDDDNTDDADDTDDETDADDATDDADGTTNETSDDTADGDTDDTTDTDDATDTDDTNGDDTAEMDDADDVDDTDDADATDDSDVIAPNTSDGTDDGATDDDVPLTAVPLVLILLVGGGAVRRLSG